VKESPSLPRCQRLIEIVDDAVLARDHDNPFTADAPNERKPEFAGDLDAPTGEAGARKHDRYAHLRGFDDHAMGQPVRGIGHVALGRVRRALLMPYEGPRFLEPAILERRG
jgi:hypothetical protein